VAHIGGVPIEAFDLSHPMLSIYDDRIYNQRDRSRRGSSKRSASWESLWS
jgi:hypothetical protein